MKLLPFKNTQRIILEPGEYYVSTQQEVISTLLGSCVAACLYDPVNQIIGMNHFLLAYRQHANARPVIETDEGRYGIYAMEILINAMMKNGANRLNLKSKCFGGANVLKLKEEQHTVQTVGDINVQFIKEFLKNENIPLIGAGLGGDFGRNIHFVGTDYSVYVKKIFGPQTLDLENQERRYWREKIKEHEQTSSQADFW